MKVIAMMMQWVALTVLCHLLVLSTTAFLPPTALASLGRNSEPQQTSPQTFTVLLASSDEPSSSPSTVEDRKNTAYVESLLENLMSLLDKWILTGSAATKQGAYNVLQQIELHARDPELVKNRQTKNSTGWSTDSATRARSVEQQERTRKKQTINDVGRKRSSERIGKRQGRVLTAGQR